MNEMVLKFAKGLSQRSDPELADGLLECADVDFTQVGSIRAIKQNDSALTYGNVVHSLSLEGLATTQPLMAGVGTTIYDGATPIRTGLTNGFYDFASINGRIYFTDTTQLYKYDGTNVWYAGTPAPSTALTATDNAAAGGMDGTFNFKVTFQNSDGADGNPSTAASVTTGASNHTIDLTNIPVNTDANYNVTKRRLWIQGGTSPFYPNYILLRTINDNTTTAVSGIISTTATTSGDVTVTLDTDNDLPPANIKYIVNHYGVLVAAGMDKNSLQYTKTNKPDQWPVLSSFIIGRSDDEIMRPKPWNGATYIVTRKNIIEMIGSPGQGLISTNFYVKTTMAQYGTIASRSVVETPYGLFYWAEDGIRRFDGGKSELFSYDIIDEYDARNKNDDAEKITVGVFFDDKLIYSFCSGTSTIQNKTLVYDFRTETWRTHSTGYRSFTADRKNRTLYCGTSGGVDRWQNGTSYLAWAVTTAEKTGKLNTPTAWGEYWIDLNGSANVEIYYDGSLAGTQQVSTTTRQLVQRNLPFGLAQRVKIRLSGSAKSVQDEVFSLSLTGEAQGA